MTNSATVVANEGTAICAGPRPLYSFALSRKRVMQGLHRPMCQATRLILYCMQLLTSVVPACGPLFPPGGLSGLLQISNAGEAHADLFSVLKDPIC